MPEAEHQIEEIHAGINVIQACCREQRITDDTHPVQTEEQRGEKRDGIRNRKNCSECLVFHQEAIDVILRKLKPEESKRSKNTCLQVLENIGE